MFSFRIVFEALAQDVPQFRAGLSLDCSLGRGISPRILMGWDRADAIFRSSSSSQVSVITGLSNHETAMGQPGGRGPFCGLPMLDPFPVPPLTVVAEREPELATPRTLWRRAAATSRKKR